jgi:hypothetical protein
MAKRRVLISPKDNEEMKFLGLTASQFEKYLPIGVAPISLQAAIGKLSILESYCKARGYSDLSISVTNEGWHLYGFREV